MSLIFIILSETFISYSTFIQFSRDYFSLQDYVKFSLYANICECVWCIYCFKSHWESADCLLPLSFFHLSINLLLEFCVCVCVFPFLPSVCLCIQRRVFQENNGRKKLVIYHYTVMGALLPLKEVSVSQRYHSPSLLTFCSH